MSQQRETATDRLVSIIQLLQLGKRTGSLTARRGEGVAQEEGTITFVKGQVTQANVGRRNGSEALNTLTTWGSCRFTFDSFEEPANQPSLPIQPRSNPPTNITNDVEARIQTPTLGSKRTDSLWIGSEVGVRAYPEAPGGTTPIPTTSSIAPYRVRQIDSALRTIESIGLSRAHRRLFLLIDGQRTTAELVRLMGRSASEVYKLLGDLEKAAVIQMPGGPNSNSGPNSGPNTPHYGL